MMEKTRLWHMVLKPLVDDGFLTLAEAVAIYRCCFYSGQIEDVSIGNMFRTEIDNLLKEN